MDIPIYEHDSLVVLLMILVVSGRAGWLAGLLADGRTSSESKLKAIPTAAGK